MAAITEAETHLLKSFRHRLKDLDLGEQYASDYELVRWIRAREHDLDAAENMARSSFKWQRENKFDQILSWQPTYEYQNRYPYHVGVTRDNGIVLFLLPGRMDLRSAVASEENKQMFLKYLMRCWEESALMMKGRINSEGIPVTQATVIVDFEGFSLASALSLSILGLVKDIALQFEAHQPERLRSAFMLNASKIVSILFSFLKSILPGNTFIKLAEVDRDPVKATQFLLEIISEEDLPMLYGGQQADSRVNQFLKRD